MTIRYEYKSTCCGHEYIEQRRDNEEMFFTQCNACGKENYELTSETILLDTVEETAVPEQIEEPTEEETI
jgi:hypothetical protein